MQRLAAAALVVAPWSSPRHPSCAEAALSVMPHQSDAIVMQLRSAILVHEKDLIGPIPSTSCSSLDDGPFCDPFGRSDLDFGFDWGLRTQSSSSRGAPNAADGGPGSAMFVVDGVLSNRLQTRNKEALNWGLETYRTFSTLVSRVISDAASDMSGGRPSSQSSTARTGSQCFRIAFDQLIPGQLSVPANFSAGLPDVLAMTWDGLWQPEFADYVPRTGKDQLDKDDLPLSRTRVVLRDALGYIRFAEPVVLRRFVVGVPAATLAGVGSQAWGKNALICGRLQGEEQWCVSLNELVGASAEETDGESPSLPLRMVDISNSIVAIDEIVVLSTPKDGLRLAMLEVGATVPGHPVRDESSGQRRVVMLKRPAGKRGPLTQLEPVLATVSRDASMWDLNDVVRLNMQLRIPSAGSDYGVAHTSSEAGSSSSPGSSGSPPNKAMKKDPKQSSAISSLQGMLRGLKANVLKPPLGVTYARLKREVSILVASTTEIQDEDVLVHSRIETLLQQRLREKSLDGLLVLQAAWQDLMEEYRAGNIAGERAEKLQKLLEFEASSAASSSSSESSASSATSSSAHRSQSVTEDVEQAAQTGNAGRKEWVDSVDQAMSRASAKLEQKSSEAQQRQKLLKSAAGQFELNMIDGGGSMDLNMREGLSSQLQELVSKAMAKALNNGVGVATATMSVEDAEELGALDIENVAELDSASLTQLNHLDDLSASLTDALGDYKDALAEVLQSTGVDDGEELVDVQAFTIGSDFDGSNEELAELLKSALRKRLKQEETVVGSGEDGIEEEEPVHLEL